MTLQKTLAFTITEYERRVAGVQRQMRAANLDLMLATTMGSVCYLTGIESVSPHKFWLAAVPGTGRPWLICQDFESANALISSWVEPGPLYGIAEDPLKATAGFIGKLGMTRARIGLELGCYSSLSGQGYLALKALLPDADLQDATSCVPMVMAVKSEPEIQCLRRAGRITRVAMEAMIEAIAPGKSDNDAAAAAYHSLTVQGSEYASYPVIITTGARSGVPHSTYHRQRFEPGGPTLMEIAGVIDRYQTPMMRVAVLGKPVKQVQEMADACVASVNAMIENIRPGVAAREVAARSARFIDALPYKIVWHGYYGYSVGLGFPPEWSDHPELGIRVQSREVLEAGMVFHCSTSLRDIGVYGTTCSETILVTRDGCEVLTEGLARKLFVR